MTTASLLPSTTAATTSSAASQTTTGTQTDIAAGQTNLASGYSTFLTLLTTQLKNQDPTSPLDTNQFTSQLVQMTGVQQQLLSNQLLQQIANSGSGASGVTSSVSLIGKTVTAATGTGVLDGGKIGWSYNLPSSASNATLTVSDSTGKAIWSGSAPDFSAGTHAFTWNGQDSSGVQRADGGSYTLSVTAADTSGAAIAAAPLLQGVVTGVQTDSTGAATVRIGASSAPVSTITGVAKSS